MVNHESRPVGPEKIILLDQNWEAGIQCYRYPRRKRPVWRVEVRHDGEEVFNARMFGSAAAALSFVRELQQVIIIQNQEVAVVP